MNYIFDPNTKTYVIDDFETAKEQVRSFIEDNALLGLVLQSQGDYVALKEARTLVNKKVKEVSDLRKELNKAAMGTFNEQAKEIEKMLKEASEAQSRKMEEWEEAHGGLKPKKVAIEVRSFDAKAIDKVKAFAVKLGCEVKDGREAK